MVKTHPYAGANRIRFLGFMHAQISDDSVSTLPETAGHHPLGALVSKCILTQGRV